MRNLILASLGAMALMAAAPAYADANNSPPAYEQSQRAQMAEIGRAFASGKHGAPAVGRHARLAQTVQPTILAAAIRFATGGRG